MSKFDYVTFFDVENSLLNFEIKFSFLEYFLLETLPMENYARRSYEKFIKRNNKNLQNGVGHSLLNRDYYKNFSGMPEKLLSEIGYSWFYKLKLEQGENFFKQISLFEIAMHKRNKAKIVLLSNSFSPCLEPLMDELCVNFSICTELEVLNGYYTGNIVSDPLLIEGKEKAIKNFLDKQESNKFNSNIEKISSFEYSEGHFCDIAYDHNERIESYLRH